MLPTRLDLTVLLIGGLVTMTVAHADRPRLLPLPKRIEWQHGRNRVSDSRRPYAAFVDATDGSPQVAAGIRQVNDRLRELGAKALPVVERGSDAHPSLQLIWVGMPKRLRELEILTAKRQELPARARVADGYALRSERVRGPSGMSIIGYDERGCYYGLQTLRQLIEADDGGAHVPRVGIIDWPTYRVRLVKVSATMGDAEAAKGFAELLPQYKLNAYGLQYHNERAGTWLEPSERCLDVWETVGEVAKRDGVVEPGVFLSPFFRPRIDVTKPDEVESYIDRLRWAIGAGFEWVEIDFNDWAKWEYLSEAEKERFADTAEFTAYLTNEVHRVLKAEHANVGIILCPMVGWYHGPANDDVAKLCQNVPGDVLVYWTGPVVRSRRIADREVLAWTETTGRKPFLWDNTIYAHFQPFWVGCAFNPFRNTFPDDLPDLLDGPGIHLNANASWHYLPSLLTFADYMWNPDAYDPAESIRAALRLCWGDQAPDAAQSVQDAMVALHQYLYEAGKGWTEYDPDLADALLDTLADATFRMSEITDDAGLAAAMEAELVEVSRAVALDFEPPDELNPRPLVTDREIGGNSPDAWSFYGGAGGGRIDVGDDGSAGLEATKWYADPSHAVHKGRHWINVGLIYGSELRGLEGFDAYDVESGAQYRYSFRLKGTVPRAEVICQGWGLGLGPGSRHELVSELIDVAPTDQWTPYSGTFRAEHDTRKFALKIVIKGYEDEGMGLGEVWVDEVVIERAK